MENIIILAVINLHLSLSSSFGKWLSGGTISGERFSLDTVTPSVGWANLALVSNTGGGFKAWSRPFTVTVSAGAVHLSDLKQSSRDKS